jgi:hypothetical protein
MYVFGTFVLLALGIMGLTLFGERYVVRFRELGSVVAVGLGIAIAWLADFNLWAQWGLAVREAWIGTTLTGLALGGTAILAQVILSLFTGVSRKVSDEADALERRPELRSAA